MVLKKFSNKVILKELCLRNFSNTFFKNYLNNKFKSKVYFPLNNYNCLNFFGESFFFFSFFFYSFFCNNFNLKFCFSKKIFIKRRKKKIKRQLKGFYIFLNSNETFNLLEKCVYFYSLSCFNFLNFKNLFKLDNNIQNLNLSVESIYFFDQYFNNLFKVFNLSKDYFFSFFFFKGFCNLSFFFFLRSLGFSLTFSKINLIFN